MSWNRVVLPLSHPPRRSVYCVLYAHHGIDCHPGRCHPLPCLRVRAYLTPITTASPPTPLSSSIAPSSLIILSPSTPTPTKTVHGIFNTQLNKVWHKVAPQICSLLKDRRIRYSDVTATQFFTQWDGEDGDGSLGPIVIWIATHPGTTTVENAHDASPDIISLLEEFEVKGAVVEWYEGSVERL